MKTKNLIEMAFRRGIAGAGKPVDLGGKGFLQDYDAGRIASDILDEVEFSIDKLVREAAEGTGVSEAEVSRELWKILIGGHTPVGKLRKR